MSEYPPLGLHIRSSCRVRRSAAVLGARDLHTGYYKQLTSESARVQRQAEEAAKVDSKKSSGVAVRTDLDVEVAGTAEAVRVARDSIVVAVTTPAHTSSQWSSNNDWSRRLRCLSPPEIGYPPRGATSG